MDKTASKPMPDNLEQLRIVLADMLEEARKLFKYPEQRRLTILVRQPGEPERDCVVTDDTSEGIREIVDRRHPLRSPSDPQAMTNEVKAAVERAADRIQTASEGPTGTGIFASEAIEIILSELAALSEQREPVAWRAWRSGPHFDCWVYWDEDTSDSLKDCPEYSQFQALYAAPVSKEPGEVPEVTHYQGARVKCTPHMRPIIDLESRDDKFDYYLVRAEVKSPHDDAGAIDDAVAAIPDRL